MDIDTIPPGVDFTDYVRRAVGSCDVLLAFIGDRWLDLADESGRRRIDDPDDWVAEEIRVALARDVRVIPVLVDGAAMPTPAQLPESLWSLVNRQALPLRHSSFSADLARLIAGIEHARSGGTSAAGAPLPQPSAAGPAAPVTAEFAERWDRPPAGTSAAPPIPVHIPSRIPEARPGRRRLLIGVAIVVLAALVGVGWAVLRPAGDRSAAPPPSSTAPAERIVGAGALARAAGRDPQSASRQDPAGVPPDVSRARAHRAGTTRLPAGRRPVHPHPRRARRTRPGVLLLLRLRRSRCRDHCVPGLLRARRSAGRGLHRCTGAVGVRARRHQWHLALLHRRRRLCGVRLDR